MDPLQFLVPLDGLEAARPVVIYGLLALAIANMGTRLLAHRQTVEQAEDGDDEALTRNPVHVATSFLLVIFVFAFTVLEPHGGFVASVLVLGTFLADFFEFESRKVEVRNGLEVQRPKSAVTASVLVLLYVAYQSVFFVIQPVWSAIV